MNLVLVHGTHGRADAWHQPDSPLRAEARARGYTVYDFRWSGVLAGVPTTLPGDPLEAHSGADAGALLPWLDAGEKLCLFLHRHELVDSLYSPMVLTHSHGLQVVTYACVQGAAFNVAVSVAGPIRRDMLRARRIAMERIGTWVQFADPDNDDELLAGEWFDGGPRGATMELPEGTTISTPGLGHNGLLYNAAAREKHDFWTWFETPRK